MTSASPRQAPSERVYAQIRSAIMHGKFVPEQPLKPQELATRYGVSLAVVRESLLRLVGEGLAERMHNRGFHVPAISDDKWQQIAEARGTIEPIVLGLAIERGDLAWEARVRAVHHRLVGTPMRDPEGGPYYSDTWSEAHRVFHRTLLEGCGNDVLLTTFDRFWTSSELARRWSIPNAPERDIAGEHLQLEEAALSRDAPRAIMILSQHLGRTAAALKREVDTDLQKGV